MLHRGDVCATSGCVRTSVLQALQFLIYLRADTSAIRWAVLGAEQGDHCAAAGGSGGAESWVKAPSLGDVMERSVQHAGSLILFFQAGNDHTLGPRRTLYGGRSARHESVGAWLGV
jgi:hypothetical protein